MLISVVVPVFNEEKRLDNLERMLGYLHSQRGYDWEVVAVDDGSVDNTLKGLREIETKEKGRIKVITYQPNRGKGRAVRTGMMAAKGDFCLFLDVDLSTPIEEMERFMPVLKDGEVVIGTRKIRGARVEKRQSWIRESLGRGFTWMSRVLLGVGVSDFTCGFKCFSRKAAKEIFKRQRIDRWGFDSEILFLAKKYGYKIREVPVTWSNDVNTKVKFPRDLVGSLADMAMILTNNYLLRVY